jgi:hypothetical protein
MKLINEEDVPTNSVGAEIAGIGIGPEGEPGIKEYRKKKKFKVSKKLFMLGKMLRRKIPTFRAESFDEYSDNGAIITEITDYAKKNLNSPIILENEENGAIMYLRYGKE